MYMYDTYVGQILCFLSASVSDVPPPVPSPKYGSKKGGKKILVLPALNATSCGCTAYKTLPAERAGDHACRHQPSDLLQLVCSACARPGQVPLGRQTFCLTCSIKTLMTTPCIPLWSRSLEEGVKGSTNLPKE